MRNVLEIQHRGELAFFDPCIENLGKSLHDAYVHAQPFPHAVIDDFLPPVFAKNILAAFPEPRLASVERADAHQFLKRGYRPDDLGDNPCRAYLYAFSTRPFLAFLECLTGIRGLISDPYFLGGGLHEIGRGGHLSIHADFNLHRQLNLLRRVNVLIYLNEDWDVAYGGNLELWDAAMERCVVSIAPLFNRCVVFNTDRTSFHGHPEPLECPEGRTRRSIALYYYSVLSDVMDTDDHSSRTDWRVRPGTRDARSSSWWRRFLVRPRRLRSR